MEHLLDVLSRYKLPLSTEIELKNEMEKIFIKHEIIFRREFRLDSKNILDFYVGDIGIEVKIKGSAKTTYKQCERYCQFPVVNQLLLVTNKAHGMPSAINTKRIHVLRLGVAWL